MELDLLGLYSDFRIGELSAYRGRAVLLGVSAQGRRSVYILVLFCHEASDCVNERTHAMSNSVFHVSRANQGTSRYMLAPDQYKTVFSYVIGWLTSLAWIATVAIETLFAGTIIQGIMILDDASYADSSKPWQGTLLTWAVMLGCIFINVVIPAWLPKIEVFILVLHIAGFVAIVATLVSRRPLHAIRGADKALRRPVGINA